MDIFVSKFKSVSGTHVVAFRSDPLRLLQNTKLLNLQLSPRQRSTPDLDCRLLPQLLIAVLLNHQCVAARSQSRTNYSLSQPSVQCYLRFTKKKNLVQECSISGITASQITELPDPQLIRLLNPIHSRLLPSPRQNDNWIWKSVNSEKLRLKAESRSLRQNCTTNQG